MLKRAILFGIVVVGVQPFEIIDFITNWYWECEKSSPFIAFDNTELNPIPLTGKIQEIKSVRKKNQFGSGFFTAIGFFTVYSKKN